MPARGEAPDGHCVFQLGRHGVQGGLFFLAAGGARFEQDILQVGGEAIGEVAQVLELRGGIWTCRSDVPEFRLLGLGEAFEGGQEPVELIARGCEGEDRPLTYDACALRDVLGREQALVVVLLTAIDTGNLAKLIMCEHWNFDGADSWKLR